jgi:hypothetical protein
LLKIFIYQLRVISLEEININGGGGVHAYLGISARLLATISQNISPTIEIDMLIFAL